VPRSIQHGMSRHKCYLHATRSYLLTEQ